MSDYLHRANAIFLRINELAAISQDSDGITRTFGTPAFLAGSARVLSWMQQAGLQCRVDHIGNVRGRLLSSNPAAKTLVIASHIDTVVNAGKFDGPLGVLVGLDLLAALIANKTILPFHIELIAFSDEEGVRFHTTYLGSKVVTGAFDPELLNKKDQDGHTLSAVITGMGGQPELLQQDVIAPADWLGYFEVHIEQGPVLYQSHIPVAVVTAIAGQKRMELTFTGFAGHAGTVPMDMRSDALCAAAEFVQAVEQFAIANKNNLVATVGKLDVAGAASNVIPGKVICTLDLRSPDDEQLTLAYHQLKAICTAIALKRQIELNWHLVQETAAVKCNEGLNILLKQAIELAGIQPMQLVSGAGHDAVPVSKVAPAAMLFVRCYKGISHNPLEHAEPVDVAAAIQVSENFIHQLIKQYQTQYYGNISIDAVGS